MHAPAKYLFDLDFAPASKAAAAISLADHKALLAEAETRGYRNGFHAAEIREDDHCQADQND